MKKLVELKGSGGFRAAVIEEDESMDTTRIRVLPPAWRTELAIAQSAMQDEQYVEATLDHAVHDLVTLVLKNPLIAERVEEMVTRAYSEGKVAGWREARR